MEAIRSIETVVSDSLMIALRENTFGQQVEIIILLLNSLKKLENQRNPLTSHVSGVSSSICQSRVD